MDTNIDTNETPKRRLEDRHPSETIAWDKPGAPAVSAPVQAQSCLALRHVASMVVNAEGVSVFPTPAASCLEHGHYMLSAPGAQLAASAPPVTVALSGTDRAAEAAQPASSDLLTACRKAITALAHAATNPLYSTAYDELSAAIDAEVESRSRPSATSGDAPDLAQLKALALAATPGPWRWVGSSLRAGDIANDSQLDIVLWLSNAIGGDDATWAERLGACGKSTEAAAESNARFIARANPAVVLDLIARIERAAAPAPDWISYDDARDTLTIYGIKYSGELMRDFGRHMPQGQLFELVARQTDGALVVKRVEPATASGDDLTERRIADLSSEHEYVNHSGGRDFDRYGFARAVEREARAAVSAATKPTADLSNLTRYDITFSDEHEWIAPNEQGNYVKLADVQSLLATKPAPLADINAKQLVNDLCNIAAIYSEPARHERMTAAVSQYLATKPAAPAVPESVRLAGAKMANTMFNLAQRCGDVIDSDLCSKMDAMRKEWDNALFVSLAAAPMASADAVIQAKRYRKLRDLMCFSEGSDGKATMTLNAPLPAPHHDFKVDWIGDRFDVSVNLTVDALPDDESAGAEGSAS